MQLTLRWYLFPIYIGLCVFYFFLITNIAFGQQIAIGASGGDLSIDMTPEFPQPYSDVHLSVVDSAFNTIGATITWYVDGVMQKNKKNERTITITSKKIGEETRIDVAVKTPQGIELHASRTIQPNVIDIIIESDTYVPYFYQGRALPSSESTLRATALVHNGLNKNRAGYSYRWVFDDTVLFEGASQGKYSVFIPVKLFQTGDLSVEVYSQDGSLVGTASTRVKIMEPILMLYEFNPLRGLLENSIKDNDVIRNQEISFYAEPYFMNTESASNARYEWRINGKKISLNNNLNTLTLNATDGGGPTHIDLTAYSNSLIPQIAQKRLAVEFNSI